MKTNDTEHTPARDNSSPPEPGWRPAEILVPVLLMAAGAAFALPATSLAIPSPGQDAGVFHYVAWRMLQGELPYRDVWDHKPPVIYFIGAAGQWLGRGTLWGMAVLQAASLFVGLLLAWRILRRPFGLLPSFLAIVLGFFTALIVGTGLLMTEEFTLLYAFVAAALYMRTLERGVTAPMALGLGLTTMLAFLTKQILIGMQLSACILLAVHLVREKRWNDLLRSIGWFLMACVVLLCLTVGYFWARGGLREFWDAVAIYNLNYAEPTDMADKVWATYIGSVFMRESGLLYPAVAGLGIAVLISINPTSRRWPGFPLVALALVDLPFEVWFTSLSGRAYNHYFYCWIPALVILSAVCFRYLFQGLPRADGRPLVRVNPRLLKSIAILYVVGVSVVPIMHWQHRMFDVRFQDHYFHRGRAVRLIRESTSPDDPVLMWGSEATVNFASRRRSPTRFVFQSPLHEPFHPAPDIVETFFREIREDPPALVIDTSWSGVIAPPIDRERWNRVIETGDKQRPREGIREVADYILENYVYVGRLLNWHVYARPGFEVTLPPMTHRERHAYTY